MTRVVTSIVGWLGALLVVMALTAVARAQTAQPLALGQVASGQFTTQTDAAYYEVAAATADPLVVALRGSASSGAYRLEVHQGALAGPTVGVLREYATDKSVTVEVPSPGSYFVTVSSTTTGSRTYELKAEQRAPIAVTLATTLAGQSLWSGGDAWYYRVAAATADPLLVMLAGTTFSSDYELEVRLGSLGGTSVGTLRETGNDQSIEVPGPAPGDYWIVVRGAADGARTFDLRVEQRLLVETPSGTNLTGQPLWTVGDTWYYHVQATSSDPLLVMVQGSTFASSYALELNQGSPAGTSVGVLRQYQNGQSLELQAPVPGDYFAVVRAVAADASSFNLQVVQRPPVAVTPATPLTAQPLWVPGDAWYYRITASTDPLQVLLRGSTFSSGYALELHQGSLTGPAVGTSRDGTNEKAIDLASPSAGTYFAVVRSTTDGERTFDFDVEQRTTPTVVDASTLSGQSLWGLGDARYYRVTVATADPLLLMVQGSTFASDLAVEVRQGSPIGPVVGVTTAYGNDTSVEVKTPALGDYYVTVRSVTDGARSFSLRVDQRGTQVMQPSASITGQLLSGVGDTRYYVVSVTGGDGLVVWLSGSDLTTNYVVTVYQGSLGGPVVGVTRHEGYDLYVDVVAPQSGDYYIVVQNGSAGSRSFSLQVDQAAASVESITPKSGGNAGTLTTTIETRFLQSLSAVRLVGADLSEASGTNTRAITDNGRFTTTFDLRSLAAGQYDVVITKTDNTEFRLPAGFTVEQGGGESLWVAVTAPSMRVGRSSRVHVTYGNAGNIDSPSPWLAIGVQSQVAYALKFAMPLAWPMADSDEHAATAQDSTDANILRLPRLNSGEIRTLSIDVLPRGAGVLDILAEIVEDPGRYAESDSLAIAAARKYIEAALAWPSGAGGAANSGSDMRPCEDPGAGAFPAGTILEWTNPYSSGYWNVHYAKSIGCNQFIEMFTDGIKVKDFSPITTYRIPNKDACIPEKTCAVGDTKCENRVGCKAGDTACVAAKCVTKCYANRCREYTPDPFSPWLPSSCRVPCEQAVPPTDPAFDPTYPAKSRAISEALYALLKDTATYSHGAFCSSWDDATKSLETNCAGLVQLINHPITPEEIFDSGYPEDELLDRIDRFTKHIGLECPDKTAFKGACRNSVRIAGAVDPNAKYGPQGYGAAQAVSGDRPMPFVITFENLETATAPAQEVVVTDQLDPTQVDLTTFSLGPIAFGSHVVVPPPGLKRYVKDVDLRPEQNLLVNIDAELDPVTTIVTWRLASMDPETGKAPEDALAGFLPPDTNPPEGEGSVVFTVAPKAGLATGTEIRNRARIVFDANDPIDTAEWVNTLDSDNPASLVEPLNQMQSSATFQVCWAGADRGAGVMDYTVYVSEDGGPATVWLENTTMTCGKYTGTPGKTYTFYSVARDLVGNAEPMPASPDAQTMVDPNAAGAGGEGGTAGAGGQSNPAGSPSAGGESAAGQSTAGAGGASPATPAAGGEGAAQPSVGQAGSSAGYAPAHRVEPASGCACRTVPPRPRAIGVGLLLIAVGFGSRRRRASRPKREAKPCRQDTASPP
jgi:hypothetical protein